MPRIMKLAALALTAFLVGSPHSADTPRSPATPRLPVSEPEAEAPFVPSASTFSTPASCAAHLAGLVWASAPPAYDAAVGPYAIAPGDMRAHRVKAREWGHEIEEFRCLGAVLASRRWTHSMSGVKPFTIEDIGKMSFPEK